MRAAIYTRVSSDPRAEGRSVGEQEAECRAFCERQRWDVVQVFSDNDRSASKYAKKSRPEYEQLLNYIGERRCDVLVTWESSRAQRDLKAYVVLSDACERAGVLWSYRGKTHDLSNPDDRMATGLDALLSERESGVTRERVLRAMRANSAAGRPHGKIPYGYRREYDSSTGALVRQVVREDQAAVIRECAQRFLSGEAPYAIAKRLDARGVLPPRPYKVVNGERERDPKVRWNLTQVRRLITNPAYIARRVHRGEDVGEADWPAILDESSFYQCAAKLADPARKFSHDSAVKFLLSGVAHCGVCGGRIKVGRPRGRDSYVCHEKQCVARKVDAVDDLVTEVVLTRLENPDALALFAHKDDSNVSDALERISELRARLDGVYDVVADGTVSAAALGRIEPGVLQQIAEQEARLKRADVPTAIYELAGNPRDVWPTLLLTQQRECLKVLLDIRIMRTTNGERIFNKDAVIITWKGSAATEQVA